MKRNNGLVALGVGILILGLPIAARATMLTWAMEGTIQSVSDPLGLIGFAQVNERVRYTFTFDSDTPNLSTNQVSGRYAGLSSTFLVGTQFLPPEAPTITIGRGSYQHQSDSFNVTSWLNVDGMLGSVYFRLHDTAGTALPSPALPLQPYPLSDFAWTEFSSSILGPPSPNNPSNTLLSFTGSVDSFTPEPCSFLLFVSGCVALTIRRK